jgi:hypothetical protein
MDQEALRLLFLRKLQNGRLPHYPLNGVWSSASGVETCDVCDAVLAQEQLDEQALRIFLGVSA